MTPRERAALDHVEPEEETWCEDCGSSLAFCECGVPLDDITEEEREEVWETK